MVKLALSRLTEVTKDDRANEVAHFLNTRYAGVDRLPFI